MGSPAAAPEVVKGNLLSHVERNSGYDFSEDNATIFLDVDGRNDIAVVRVVSFVFLGTKESPLGKHVLERFVGGDELFSKKAARFFADGYRNKTDLTPLKCFLVCSPDSDSKMLMSALEKSISVGLGSGIMDCHSKSIITSGEENKLVAFTNQKISRPILIESGRKQGYTYTDIPCEDDLVNEVLDGGPNQNLRQKLEDYNRNLILTVFRAFATGNVPTADSRVQTHQLAQNQMKEREEVVRNRLEATET